MKTPSFSIFFIFITLQIQIGTAQTNIEDWDYPIRPGMAEWRKLTSGKEMHQALRIPENILSQISTERLTELCLNYPMFGDVFWYNDLQTGLDYLMKYFNGFQELMKRNDAARTLLYRYKMTNPLVLNMDYDDLNHGVIPLTYFELLISQDQLLAQLNKEELNELLAEALKKYRNKRQQSEKYSLFNQKFTVLIMARILERKNIQIQTNSKEPDAAMRLFTKYVVVTDTNLIGNILNKTIQVIKDEHN